MADFDAPQGPPPPKVPEGWVARWNEQYKEWFYVNTFTKKSQWEKPTEPAKLPADEAPQGPPPGYTPGDQPAPTDTKVNPYDTPQFNSSNSAAGPSNTESEDAKLARQLQAEEDARAHVSYSAPPQASGFGGTPSPSGYPAQLPPRSNNDLASKGKGLLGKLLGSKKTSGSSGGGLSGILGGGSHGSSHGGSFMGHHGPPGGYGQPAPYGYQSPPPQGYGGYPGQAYGQQGYGQPGYYPPQQQHYGQQGYGMPPHGAYGHGRAHKSGPGMGAMAGGAALGVGAGLVGGALVADAIHDHNEEMYQEGFEDGQMDDVGGDFGGDF